MRAEISTERYEFYLDNESVLVKFLNNPDQKTISLKPLNIEIIGIMNSTELTQKWMVCIITKESIQKLQKQVADSLELIGFHFNDRKTALTVQNFLINYLLKEKDIRV